MVGTVNESCGKVWGLKGFGSWTKGRLEESKRLLDLETLDLGDWGSEI